MRWSAVCPPSSRLRCSVWGACGSCGIRSGRPGTTRLPVLMWSRCRGTIRCDGRNLIVCAPRFLTKGATMNRLMRVAFPLLAATILVFPGSVSAAGKTKLLASATVKSVAPTTLTVTADGKDTSFSVDAKTSVIGKGIGTKSRAKGGKATIADLLNTGDRVSVTYMEEGMHATKVQLLAAGK